MAVGIEAPPAPFLSGTKGKKTGIPVSDKRVISARNE